MGNLLTIPIAGAQAGLLGTSFGVNAYIQWSPDDPEEKDKTKTETEEYETETKEYLEAEVFFQNKKFWNLGVQHTDAAFQIQREKERIEKNISKSDIIAIEWGQKYFKTIGNIARDKGKTVYCIDSYQPYDKALGISLSEFLIYYGVQNIKKHRNLQKIETRRK